jgi:hypothetical protein
MAFNSVNQTPPTIILSSSEKHDFLLKLGVGVAVVGVGGYIIYKVVQNLSGSGPAGGSCATPGTPCYEAIQPYQQQWSYCFTEYQKYMDEFVQEDLKNNITFPTPEQQSILSGYQNCMTTAEEGMTKTAKQFISANVLDNIAYILTGVAVVLLVARVSPSVVNAWKNLSTKVYNGATAASKYYSARLWGSAVDGQIPPTSVDLAKTAYIDNQNILDSQAKYELNIYYDDNVITQDELYRYAGDIDAQISADTRTVTLELSYIR